MNVKYVKVCLAQSFCSHVIDYLFLMITIWISLIYILKVRLVRYMACHRGKKWTVSDMGYTRFLLLLLYFISKWHQIQANYTVYSKVQANWNCKLLYGVAYLTLMSAVKWMTENLDVVVGKVIPPWFMN